MAVSDLHKTLITTFNFAVEITHFSGDNKQIICNGKFSECDGLEMSMSPMTIREGGNNNRPIHLVGPVEYGTLTLKRGMTNNFDLWNWFNMVNRDLAGRRFRSDAYIRILSSEAAEQEARFTFVLTGCLPVKLKAPNLNAVDTSIIAVEEIELAYETLDFIEPTPASTSTEG